VPREGYRTISATDDVYNYLQSNAQEINCSIAEYIKNLIEENNIAKAEK